MHSARGEGHGARVSREAILHHGLHRFAYCENRVCNLGRMSSLEFEDTVPVKAKVGLPHRLWTAVIHIATLILAFMMMLFCLEQMERAEHFLRQRSPLGGSYCLGLSATNQEQRSRRFPVVSLGDRA